MQASKQRGWFLSPLASARVDLAHLPCVGLFFVVPGCLASVPCCRFKGGKLAPGAKASPDDWDCGTKAFTFGSVEGFWRMYADQPVAECVGLRIPPVPL